MSSRLKHLKQTYADIRQYKQLDQHGDFKDTIAKTEVKIININKVLEVAEMEVDCYKHLLRRAERFVTSISGKLKEISKTVILIDDRTNKARLLKESISTAKLEQELGELQAAREARQANNAQKLAKLRVTKSKLEKDIAKANWFKIMRDKQEQIEQERMARLRVKMKALKKRDKAFNVVARQRQQVKDDFLSKFEELKRVFGSASTSSDISDKFNALLLSKQSQESTVSV